MLSSHSVPRALLSPMKSLTAEFGMGSGVSSSLSTRQIWNSNLGPPASLLPMSHSVQCTKVHLPRSHRRYLHSNSTLSSNTFSDEQLPIWKSRDLFEDHKTESNKSEPVTKKICSRNKNIKAKRQFSISQLNTLLHLHLWPIKLVVYKPSNRNLILWWASHLDAFSGYPFRT